MELGIFSKTIPGTDPALVLAACRQAGYSVVQFNWSSAGIGALSTEVPDEALMKVRLACKASGVQIAAISGTYNMIHPDAAERARGRVALGAIIRSAAALGVPCVTLCTGTLDATDPWRAHPCNEGAAAWAALRDALEPALDAAEAAGVDLGVEPEPGNVVSSATKARTLLRELGSTRLKIVFDPANLVPTDNPETWDRELDRDLDLLAGDIVLAHAKDRAADGTVQSVGSGAINFWHFVAGLKTRGIDVPLVTHGLPAEDAPGVARFLSTILKEAGR